MTRWQMLLRGLCCAWVAGIACCASACSLMDLGDFGLTNCEHHEQCDVRNARDGIGDGDCMVWQCRKDKRGCELRPRDFDNDDQPDALTCAAQPGPLDCDDGDNKRAQGKAETCDRRDNDCDGLIDEDVTPPLAQRTVAVQAPGFMSYAQDDSDALYMLLGTADGAQGLVVSGAEPPVEHAVSYAFPADRKPDDGLACAGADLAAGEARACEFAELALAPLGKQLVTAGVNLVGCAQGQLRVGLSDPHDFTVQLGSSAQSTNLDFGVDLSADGLCTARAATVGARSPRVAALDADSAEAALDADSAEAKKKGSLASDDAGQQDQALVLWLAAPHNEGCEGDTDVMALALFPHGEGDDRWLQGGHGGHGEPLGNSADCSPPALAPLRAGRDSGYALALAQQDAIELLWLPRPNGLSASLASSVLRARVPTAEPSHPALALLPANRPGVHGRGLLVAWRSATAIGFAPLGWSANGITPGVAQTLERGAEITAGPVAAYAAHGFATEALDASESQGGWLVLWVERAPRGAEGRSRLLALRVADVGDGRMLGDPIELSAGGDPQLPFVCANSATDSAGNSAIGFEYGFVAPDGDSGELTLGSLECPASD